MTDEAGPVAGDWADLASGFFLGSGLLAGAVLALRPMLAGLNEVSIANSFVTSLVVLLAVTAVAHAIFARGIALPPARVLAPLGALVAAGALSLAVASHAWPAEIEVWAWLTNVVFFLAVYFLAAAEGERGSAVRRSVLAAVLATAGVMALYGVYQRLAVMPGLLSQMRADARGRELLAIPGAIGRVTSGEVYATFVTPNAYAGYLAMTGVLALGVGVWAAGERRRAAAIASSTVAGAAAVALVFTGSAGGYVSAAAGVAVFGALVGGGGALRWARARLGASPGRRRAVLAVAAGLACAAAAALVVALARTPSMQVRLEYWKAAAAMIADNPFGVGLGNFADEYPRYKTPAGTETREAHNVYLSLLAEAGPIAFLAFAALLYGVIRALRGSWAVEVPAAGPDAVGPRRLGMLALAGGVAGIVGAYAIGAFTTIGMHSESVVALFAGGRGEGVVTAGLVHIAFVPIWGALFYALFRVEAAHPRVRAAVVAGLAAMLVHGLVEFDFTVRTTMLVAAALGGVALSVASPLRVAVAGVRAVPLGLGAVAVLVPLLLFGSLKGLRLWEISELARHEIARAERLEDAAGDLPAAAAARNRDEVERIVAALDEPGLRIQAANVRDAIDMGVESRLKQASSDFGMEARREARTSFSRAWDLSVEYVRRQPGDGEQVAGLARLGEMIEARRIKTDTKDAVESALRFLTDRAPRSYTAWTLLGREHAKRGHLTQAAAAFQRAAERYPLNPRAWLRVGDAAVFFDAERAIAAYARAMEVNRVVSDENTSLFAMLWSSRPVRPARPDQLVRLEARAESVECVFRGGLMIWEVGGFVDAAAKFGRALEMKPGDPQLAAFRALVLKLEALRIEDEAVSIAAKAAWDEFEVIQASAPESLRLPDRLMELFRTRSRAMRVSARGERL